MIQVYRDRGARVAGVALAVTAYWSLVGGGCPTSSESPAPASRRARRSAVPPCGRAGASAAEAAAAEDGDDDVPDGDEDGYDSGDDGLDYVGDGRDDCVDAAANSRYDGSHDG
ncbi:hypothetical protein BV20DRAFT_966262 [Pilatotrama ljubarskyi]|nr:hypothetical protein BV20DRAFT_966262 [Pilatotrama ljubarskyi]